MSIGVELGMFVADWMRSGGEFWRVLVIFGHFLAIFGDFGTENFSKCEKRALYFSVRIFGTKKIFFWVAHNNDFASFFFGPFWSPDDAGMDQQCFLHRLESGWTGLDPIGGGSGASFGEFWRKSAIFGHFWPFLVIFA